MSLLLRHKEEQVRSVKVKGRFGSNNLPSFHEMGELMVLRGGNKANITTATTNFRRVELGLSNILLERIPWETVLESGRTG